ncbi:tRNA acetyltransferase TAN1 [Ceratocystis platani]|uniref:tRNA acetyltransferase TAN1 n=1 Tax=Ceratocystis fimbriata f. sp. platani TaxID=88771 RepID=A0A0F8B3S1_CERFI|nr:tRNA acetyltransferase TAN1 [Ceratocystis platani]
MTDNKRKEGPGGGQRGGQNKKNKGSHQGRWQTPHQKNKMANLAAMGNKVDAGDVGIWVTCQRKLEKKAMNEMISICDELCEKLYGIIPPTEEEKERHFSNKPTQDADKDSEDEDEDIEASIKKELEVSGTSKATETAVVSLSRDILGSVFKLRANEGTQQETPAPESQEPQEGTEATETIASSTESAESSNPTTDKTAAKEEIPAYTYAIRTSKRNHNSLSTDTVVKSVAGQVSLPHKVNLTSPDKMVLIELFRNIAGISVVEGADFERLRKFNLDSIYKLALDEAAASRKPADPGSVDASTPTPTEQEGADAMVSGGV